MKFIIYLFVLFLAACSAYRFIKNLMRPNIKWTALIMSGVEILAFGAILRLMSEVL